MIAYALFAEWVTPALWEKLFDEAPVLVFFLILWFYFLHRLGKEHDKLIRSKNEEIERTVEQRNYYQNIVYGERLSTISEPEPPKPEPPKPEPPNGVSDDRQKQDRSEETADVGKTTPKKGKKKKND